MGMKEHEMLRIEKRRIKKWQLADVKVSFLNEYFADINRISDIILVFDNGNCIIPQKSLFEKNPQM